MTLPTVSGCLLVVLVAAAPSQAQVRGAPEAEALPFELKVSRLTNGMTVVRVPYDAPGLVAYRSVVRAGARDDPEESPGLAYLFRNLMYRGTPRFPAKSRVKVLGPYGFSGNTFVEDDLTVFHNFGPSEALRLLVEIEGDRFQNLAYSAEDYRLELEAVTNEHRRSAGNPDLKIEGALRAALFARHPYRRLKTSSLEALRGLSEGYERSRELFRCRFTPENLMLFVVGDFDDGQLMGWINEHYGPWKSSCARPLAPPAAEGPLKGTHRAHVESPDPRHIVAWRDPAVRPDVRSAAIQKVLASYLTGLTSPLYEELVLKAQLADGASASFQEHRDPFPFWIDVRLKAEEHRAAVQEALDEAVGEVAAGRIDVKRLEGVKDNLRLGVLMRMQTADDVAALLGWHAGIFGTPDALERLFRELSRVSPADLTRFARQHLSTRNRVVLTAGQIRPDAASSKERP